MPNSYNQKLLLKVCGITNLENAQEVASLAPTMMGFILYPKSPRFVQTSKVSEIASHIPDSILRVGVAVNMPLEEAAMLADTNLFNYLQLHGNEAPEYCAKLSEKIKLIKAFGVDNQLPKDLEKYEPYCSYFLFDTKSEQHGGTGLQFNHQIVEQYNLTIPFILSGGIGVEDVEQIKRIKNPKLAGIDVNSKVEVCPGIKNMQKLSSLAKKITPMIKEVNELGYYGSYGGAYIPEMLQKNVTELADSYREILSDPSFKSDFERLLHDYVGRPTPLFHAEKLSKKYGYKIYLKREDLCHTGSHKLNNVIGQALLAKRLGKTKIIAETGAGQHGVASATVAALLGLECTVFMGEVDMQRQYPNVMRMKMLGATVIPATSGTKTLKDACNEAIRYWIANTENTHYLIGSVIGPHPYPDLVAQFQSVISEEIGKQLEEKEGRSYPDAVLACVGGGSNAAGAFYHFIDNENVMLFGAEAGGCGADTEKTAATLTIGTDGIIHGTRTILMQTPDGQVCEAHSISAGLDYPGVGPLHAHLHHIKRATYLPINDDEAIAAAFELTQQEGIIPALESSHALALLPKLGLNAGAIVVVNLSGRGDKDMQTYISKLDSNI